MMRYILYNSSSRKVSLDQEIGFLENYTQVESIRYGEKISINFDRQGINNRAMIEPLLLLPFIENPFKHGAAKEVENGYVRIVVCLVENELIVEVMNSKPAHQPGRVAGETAGEGIGLKNAAKRLALLYPGKHHLEINETETDYELRLTLQLDTDG
jgi:LytS/YehU family sensor histidine kinase